MEEEKIPKMSDLSKLPGIEDCLCNVFSYCTIEDLLTCHKLSSSWKETLESHSLIKCWTSRLEKLVQDNDLILSSCDQMFGQRYKMDGSIDESKGQIYITGSRQLWNKICYKFIKEGSIEDIIQFSTLLVASLKRVERPMNREGPIEWMDPLHIAVLESDIIAVKFLLPFTKVYGKYKGKTPFILACEQKEAQIIKLFLEMIEHNQFRNIFHDVDHEGKSGFMWLCYHGLNDLIKGIEFSNYISIDEPRDRDGSTPLMTATMRKHYSTVELLIQKGANVNAKDKSGKTAFTLATWLADLPMINLYFQYAKEKSMDFNAIDKSGRTAFIYACMLKLEEVVNLFREKAEEFEIDLLKKDIDGLMGSDFIEIRENQDEFDFVQELGNAEEWNGLSKNERRLRFYNRELRDKPENSIGNNPFPSSRDDDYKIDEDRPVWVNFGGWSVKCMPSEVEATRKRHREQVEQIKRRRQADDPDQMEQNPDPAN